MRTRHYLLIAAALVAPTAATAAERIVDYSIDEATAAAHALEQGVPLTPVPRRGLAHVAVVVAPEVDHEVIRAGIACGAWKIRNPLSVEVRRFASALDRDGAAAEGSAVSFDLLVKVDRAATLSRCVSTGEMKSACIYRVTIVGSVKGQTGVERPLRIEREAVAKGVGICAGLTRGIGLVGRSATAAFFEEAAKKI
ncbi:hypothetical protein [Sphingomonas sp. GB1N7]|uniref:hypothetical protein n=1 Tax=Parasphingomonas caseinilytica TaxID=3096158 RepID=UPI002FC7629D